MTKALLRSLAAMIAATALAGCATQPTRTAAATPAPNCIRNTASRTQKPEGSCANVAGATYSQSDIQSTGQIDTAAALRRLDPRFN